MQDGLSLMHEVANSGNIEEFKIVTLNLKTKNAKNDAGVTPLHLAAMNGHQDLFLFLFENIKKKSELNPRDKMERTPLDLAAENGHIEICKVIIDKLVMDGNHLHSNLMTPLHVAASKGKFLSPISSYF